MKHVLLNDQVEGLQWANLQNIAYLEKHNRNIQLRYREESGSSVEGLSRRRSRLIDESDKFHGKAPFQIGPGHEAYSK